MTLINRLLGDFPSHNVSVATALFLILVTGLTVVVKLALGHPFPANYEVWGWQLVTLAGVNVVGLIGKRATEIDYKAAGQPETPTKTTVTPDKTTVES